MLSRLGAERLQDDQRFIESYVRSRAGRGYGPLRVAAELRQRGIAEPSIQTALAGGECDWVDAARLAYAKKFGSAGPADYRETAKRIRYLEYRGYTQEQIRAALDGTDELEQA